MEIELQQVREMYFQDAEEHLEEICALQGQLSAEGDHADAIGALFRTVHTLKGDSSALGFSPIETLLHRFESHLDLLREGSARLTEYSIDVFDVIVDCLEQLVWAEREGKPTPQGLEAAVALLDELSSENRIAPDEQEPAAPKEQPDAAAIEEELDGFGLFDEEPGEGATESEAFSKQHPAGSAEAAAGSEQLDCDPQLLAEFISDSDEHLSKAEDQLLVIEGEPTNAEALNAIYRAFHTMKGLASFLGLEATRNLAHQAESMLNLAREGSLKLTGNALEVALASVDALRRQVRIAEKWLNDSEPLAPDEQLPNLLAAIDAVSSGKEPVALAAPKSEADEEKPKPEAATPAPAQRLHAQVKETIKVDRDRLDKLINVIGELVIGHAMVQQEIDDWSVDSGGESLSFSQLEKTVRDLQELSLSLRMVPVGSVFQKMARIVRDLGRKLSKDIRFVTEGDETELDKTVVDQIGDPLLHMVRNAADHGIESPEERVAAGKPRQGTVTLRAYHQGGNIYLEIEDDGKGLDPKTLLKKAIEKGIVQEGDTLTDSEIYNLIFAPGFSTAKEVTDVSGRGVGMDVVRRNVEALQGSVSIASRKGEGSTVTIRLPLTLAILDGLSIRVGDQVFIVPILSVIESFSPDPADLKRIVGKGEVVMVRGEVVPLLRLDRLLGCPEPHQANNKPGLVVIVEDHGKKSALLVDELVGQSQVVIKNLETNYQKVDGLAGATILGDGRVAMILDIYGLVRLASTATAQDAGLLRSDSRSSPPAQPNSPAIDHEVLRS